MKPQLFFPAENRETFKCNQIKIVPCECVRVLYFTGINTDKKKVRENSSKLWKKPMSDETNLHYFWFMKRCTISHAMQQLVHSTSVWMVKLIKCMNSLMLKINNTAHKLWCINKNDFCSLFLVHTV